MLAASAPDVEADLLATQRRISRGLAAPRLDGYEVLELIGAGTYGDVWRARETQTGVIVAIKRLREQPAGISREDAEKLAQLGSARGIVALRKVHLDSEPYCYVMEHLEGGPLADEIRAGPLPFARAWDVFKQLTAALAYVHKDAIVHCDLKPANILLDTRRNPRIGDFGQARGQGPGGSSLGTRFYMPPEQAQETDPDTRWDVYALGAIFYEMLTGERPRYDPQVASRLGTPSSSGSEVRKHLEAYARQLEDSPTPDAHRAVKGVDASIARLIDCCLSTNFDDRPKDAIAVGKMIDDCERSARVRKLVRFGGWAPAIMLLAVGLVSLVAGFMTIGYLRETWIKNVNESNDAIAKAISTSVKSNFESRMNAVREQAASARLIELLRRNPKPNDSQARAIVEDLYNKQRGSTGDRPWFARWSIAKSDSTLVDNYGWSPDGTVGPGGGTNAYPWRGWFNGEEDRPAAERDKSRDNDLQKFRQRSRTQVLVSQPYHRKGTDTPVINFTCPIFGTDAGEPLGVLGGQVYYPHFLESVSDFVASESERKRNVVIVNNRFQVIYCTDLAEAAGEGKGAQFVIEKHEHELFQQAFSGTFPTEPYASRLDGRDYLGASQLIDLKNGQKFAVIVQQESSRALGGLDAIRWMAIGSFVALIGVGGLCLCLNVYALRREAVANA